MFSDIVIQYQQQIELLAVALVRYAQLCYGLGDRSESWIIWVHDRTQGDVQL